MGRGTGSGKGTTAGRGMNGQKSRSGVSIKGFEGGQMPLYRRLAKRGFNPLVRKSNAVINVGGLQKAIDGGRLDAGKPVDGPTLEAAGLIRGKRDGIRLLGKGEISTKIEITVDYASKTAAAAVEKAGGSVTITAARSKADSKSEKKDKGKDKPAKSEKADG